MCGLGPPPSWAPQPGAHHQEAQVWIVRPHSSLRMIWILPSSPHVQSRKATWVAVMPDDVVVHVDQDSGEEERRRVLRG